MTNKLNYLNNEKRLYDYIKTYQNDDGLLICNYKDLAKELNVCEISVLRYRKRLKELGLINSSCKVINGSKRLVLSIKEEN